MDIKNILKTLKNTLNKHSSEILIGVGITGMFTSTVMAVKATPKALEAIKEEEKKEYVKRYSNETDQNVNYDEMYKNENRVEIDKMHIIKATWKLYLPSIICFIGGGSCIISAMWMDKKKNAALATMYKVSEEALRTYQSKIIDTVGEEKYNEIKKEVHKEIIKPKESNVNIVCSGNGDIICYDTLTGRDFSSNIQKIDKAVNELNRRMRDSTYITLNEFYYEIGLPDVKLGDILGWDIDKGYIDVEYDSMISDNGVPWLVLDYNTYPNVIV